MHDPDAHYVIAAKSRAIQDLKIDPESAYTSGNSYVSIESYLLMELLNELRKISKALKNR